MHDDKRDKLTLEITRESLSHSITPSNCYKRTPKSITTHHQRDQTHPLHIERNSTKLNRVKMKSQVFLIALLAMLATCALAQFPFPHPSYPFPVFKHPYIGHPYPFPVPAAPSSPQGSGAGQQTPTTPQVPVMTDAQRRCYDALHDDRIGSCIQDLHSAFFNKQVAVISGCCSLLTSCRAIVPFQIAAVEQLITQYCS